MALRIVTAEERLSISSQSDEPAHASQRARVTIPRPSRIGKTSLLKSMRLPDALFLDLDDADARSKD